jgi:hypothetical protein
MTSSSTCLYFQGSAPQIGGLGTPFGDGLRCAGGTVVRLGFEVNAAGASQHPGPGDLPIALHGQASSGATRFYQAWYRDAASFCTASTFNTTNAVRVTWQP